MEKRQLIFIIIVSLVVGFFTGWLYTNRMIDSRNEDQVSNILRNHIEIKEYLANAKEQSLFLFGVVQSVRKGYPKLPQDSIALIIEDAAFVAHLSMQLTRVVEKVYKADSAALNRYVVRENDVDKE